MQRRTAVAAAVVGVVVVAGGVTAYAVTHRGDTSGTVSPGPPAAPTSSCCRCSAGPGSSTPGPTATCRRRSTRRRSSRSNDPPATRPDWSGGRWTVRWDGRTYADGVDGTVAEADDVVVMHVHDHPDGNRDVLGAPSVMSDTTFTASDGTPIALKPGQTWVTLQG